MPKTILVPVDGSGNAGRAIDFAGELAARYDAKVILLHAIHYRFGRLPDELHKYAVSEHLEGPGEVVAIVGKLLDSAEVRARNAGAGDVESDSREGEPAAVILDAAKSFDADLIVMGSRGLGELKSLLVGSVSNKIFHHADAPVTIVR